MTSFLKYDTQYDVRVSSAAVPSKKNSPITDKQGTWKSCGFEGSGILMKNLKYVTRGSHAGTCILLLI